MRRQALRTVNVCSSHGGFLPYLEADIDATARNADFNGNALALLKPAPPGPQKKSVYTFKSCRIHETHNHHD